jgi:transcriptional regulator of arginine metabolism
MIQENKQTRHFVIKQLLESRSISSQNKLRIELKKQGFKVTQATLSRDLRELGVSRSSSSNGSKYVSQQTPAIQALRPLIGEEVVFINTNENLIVIGTLPGCASVVGEFIDSQKNKDIIGTIAGDNTLLIIPSSVRKIKVIIKFLKEKLIEGKE